MRLRLAYCCSAPAFIDNLVEDFGDEWVNKAMYQNRWAYDADIDKAGRLLPISRNLPMDSDQAQQSYDFITTRQIERRALVGSTEENQPIIESSYERLLDILTQLFSRHDFLPGDRPGPRVEGRRGRGLHISSGAVRVPGQVPPVVA